MPHNHSPWIHQLNRTRAVSSLSKDIDTDVAIVGGGIAGISTAYFLLKNTTRSVCLLESDKIAHGATGHNAGQIVSYFERQISDLVKEFGIEMTAHAQRSIDSAWNLLKDIFTEANLQTAFAEFDGYAGCQDLEEIVIHLENNAISKNTGLNSEALMVAQDCPIAQKIPKKYEGLYSLIPHSEVLHLLQSTDTRYCAVIRGRKGCMNSALFCEELLTYLFKKYPSRVQLYEGSHVHKIYLDESFARLKVKEYAVRAKRVVLCTNGFERFTIINLVGPDINTKFHHLVNGAIGYMAAYLEDATRLPIAISYLPSHSHTGNKKFDENPYFYLTRRPYEDEEKKNHNLICVGGPEMRLSDTNHYIKEEHPYPEEAQAVIDAFLHKTYAFAPREPIHYKYRWHGLMGYTPNGVRCIGVEPINNVLLYNLGCNGVGILPSIYGGKKISEHIRGEKVPPSIFDPKDSREE